MPDRSQEPEPHSGSETPGNQQQATGALAPQHATTRADRAAAKRQAKLEQIERNQLRKAERAARGPGAWRTWVLPSLKLLVAALIAIALVKLAFFPGNAEAAGPEEIMPGANFEEPTVAVEKGSIENAVELDGTIAPVDPVPIRPSQSGTVARVLAADGVEVSEDDVLFTVRVEAEPEPNEDGELGEPEVAIWNITAPATGTLQQFTLLEGQSVELGGEAGFVQPKQHIVRAPVGAAEQYRLTTEPETAEVTIDSGPAPFGCTDVRIEQPTAEELQANSPATLTCRVPDEVRVFIGLAAKVELAAGSASDVLLLPTTAVLGSVDTGVAYKPTTGADGTASEPEEVKLELGISDGKVVEVRSGLAEGDEVLQFVPGVADPCADPAMADPALCGEEYTP